MNLIIMLMVLFTIVVFPVSAGNVTVEMPLSTYVEGGMINVNVTIDPLGTYIAGAQLNIEFNSSIISVNNITEGNLLQQNGANTFFNSGIINNSLGTVTNVYSAILGRRNVSSIETFLLVNVTVKKINVTKFTLNLSRVKVGTPEGVPVPSVVKNGTLSAVKVSTTTAKNASKTIASGGKILLINSTCNDQFNQFIACGGAINWSSSNISVATVNTTGKVVSVAAGMTNIIAATTAGTNSSITVIVETPRITTITVMPTQKTLNVGSTLVFGATAKNQFGVSISSHKFEWSSSNLSVGVINSSTKKFTALAAGTTLVSATNGTVTNSSVVTVI